ncbi:exoskeleton protein RP43-like [Macrobrachium nipponense]|uniref:exoskeleton protein RP43-like n=1 Tax=Macrobrachium nipponense TaxID=159736 RepID=UPI0030C88D54
MNCHWKLSMPVGKLVTITFLEFDLGSCCDCAQITLWDSVWPHGAFLGRGFCGSAIPPIVNASGSNIILIDLWMNGTSILPGFRLYYETITAPPAYLCQGDQALTTVSGLLQAFSPDTYYNNQTCSWQLTVANRRKIGIYFQWLQTESRYDIVTVQALSTSALLEKWQYSGDTAPPLLVSQGNAANISFSTDSSSVRQGFQIFYFTV